MEGILNEDCVKELVQENGGKYRSFFETSRDCVFITSRDGRLIDFNDAHVRVFGYASRDELKKIKIQDLYQHSQDRRRHTHIIEQQGFCQDFSVNLRKKDGTIINTLITSVLRRDKNGKVIGYQGTIKDVTNQKRTEEALRESERRLSEIIDFLPDATFAIDREGKVIIWNRAIEEVTGVKAKDMVGKGDHEYALPFYGIRRPILIDLLFKTDEEIAKKYRFIEKKGDVIFAETEMTLSHRRRVLSGKARPLYDDRGYVVGAIETLHDVTERERAEEERMRLSTAIEQAGEGVVVTDADWIVQYVNPAFERIAGYSREEIIGQHLRILRSDKHDRAYYKNIRETLSRGEVWSQKLTNKKKDNTDYVADVTASSVKDKTGGILNYVGIHRDITHEIRLEGLLRQSQRMETIGTLAGGIAHDFNNILGAIIGYTDLALADSELNDHLRSYLVRVRKAGERAGDLVKQILTFSRQHEQERKPVLLAPIIGEGVSLLRASLPSTVQIIQAITKDASMILADPTQIQQVVMNLCTNAAHAMREGGGTLDIRLVHERINPAVMPHPSSLAVGDYAKLTVSDTGHGIDPCIMDRIFDPFFTTKGPGEGTGLGLSVVYGIVKNCNGAINVASKPGEGTVVSVYLPLVETEERMLEWAPKEIPHGNERILLVDDEAALVEVGTAILTSLGYHVTARTSSIEALEVFRARPYGFDLVITDVTMPNMRGDHLARELLKIRSDVPIILCTGFSEIISEEKAKSLGIRKLVMKPLFRNHLAREIRKILEEG